MSRRKFFALCEQEGIASSDWKLNLWNIHTSAIKGLELTSDEEEDWVRELIKRKKTQSLKAYRLLTSRLLKD